VVERRRQYGNHTRGTGRKHDYSGPANGFTKWRQLMPDDAPGEHIGGCTHSDHSSKPGAQTDDQIRRWAGEVNGAARHRALHMYRGDRPYGAVHSEARTAMSEYMVGNIG
jgi:hypothetical protein